LKISALGKKEASYAYDEVRTVCCMKSSRIDPRHKDELCERVRYMGSSRAHSKLDLYVYSSIDDP